MVALESRGIASVMIASEPFRDACDAQARALGFAPAVVFVPHPIQDRTDAEMAAMAEAACVDIVAALTS